MLYIKRNLYMNTINNIHRYCVIILLLLGLASVKGQEQTIFFMVVEQIDGSELYFSISENYPLLRYQYGGEDGVNALEIQSASGTIAVPCPNIKRLFTRTPQGESVVNKVEPVDVDGQPLYVPSEKVSEAIKATFNADIALPAEANGRIEVTDKGGLKFSKGEDVIMALLDMKQGDVVKFVFTGRLFGDSSKLRLKSASTRGTRAAGDMELVSEAEYEVIEAGDQVVTVKLDELEATVGTISVTETGMAIPSAKNNLVYTGAAQDLIEAGSSTTGTMQYSLDGTNYSTEIPQGTDAKEYTVYYKVVANAGYSNVDPSSFKVTISPKTVSSPTITLSETSFVYDGNAKEPTATVKDGDATIPASEYTVSYKDNTEVGTATVTITDKEGGNYTVSGSVAFSITAPETPSVVNTDESVIVDGQELYEPSKEVTEAIKEAIETDIALTQKAEGRVEVTEGGGLKFSKGEDLLVGLLDMKLRDIVKFIFTGRLFGDSSKLRLKNASTRGTRAAGDMELVSEAEYEVIEAGDQVVTVKLEEGEATVETIAITESEKTPITIGKSGKASYCGDQSLDFSFSDEVKAYIATGFDKDEGTIWLTRVKDVPAGVPVLIKGEANKTYNVPVTDSQNSYYTNMFVGNMSGEKMVIQETDGDMVNYYLSGDGTFKSVNKTANIGTNKCYLQLPGTFAATAAGAAQTVKVGSLGKASFAAPVDLDFTNVSGLKAFTATGYDKSTKTIWLTRVMKVQKGEGVLLKGDPNSYEVPSAAVQSSYENMFVGNTSGNEIQVQETSEDGSQTNYYLSGKDGSFVKVSGYANINTNKCYLELPTSMVSGAASTRSSADSFIFEEPEMIKLPISFRSLDNDGDGTTAIRDLTPALSEGEGAWYTLQGQRVAKPGKGVYIKNGRKVVIK